MKQTNIEIKARCPNPDKIREALKEKKADFEGIDHQVDTYFKVKEGKLKLREGKIENALIYYQREARKGPKESSVFIFYTKDPALKKILIKAWEVLVVVEKKREIYFLRNVKFHIDKVKNLGSFVEIEAIDRGGAVGNDELTDQCKLYMKQLGIKKKDLVKSSYSDMLLKIKRV